MNRKISFTLVMFMTAFASSSAFAYCRDPGRAPEAPRSYEKPKQPTCLADARYGEEPQCEQFELDRYQRETERYLDKLQEYADEAQQYAREAVAYAQCEAAETRDALN